MRSGLHSGFSSLRSVLPSGSCRLRSDYQSGCSSPRSGLPSRSGSSSLRVFWAPAPRGSRSDPARGRVAAAAAGESGSESGLRLPPACIEAAPQPSSSPLPLSRRVGADGRDPVRAGPRSGKRPGRRPRRPGGEGGGREASPQPRSPAAVQRVSERLPPPLPSRGVWRRRSLCSALGPGMEPGAGLVPVTGRGVREGGQGAVGWCR